MKKRTKAKVLAANVRKLVINPFVSEAQRRACYAKDDTRWDCKEWSAVTPKGKLPVRKKRKLMANVRRRLLANAKAPNPLKIDPTRTLTMRRAFATALRKAFALLIGRIVKLVVDDDAFGLGRRQVLGNAFCPGEGARDNSCSSVVTTHHTVTSGSNAGLHVVGVFKKGAKGYAAGEHVLADKVKVPEGHTAEDMVGFAAARPNKDGTHYVAQVHVDEPHRRQGLASSMYDTLRTKGVTLGKSPLQTDLGDKFRTGYESKYSASNVVANEHPYVALLSQEKIKAFQDWLRRQNHDLLTSQTQKELWLRYAEQGFRKGQGRAFDDVRQSKLAASRPDLVGPEAQQSLRDFYAGTKDEFLRSSFGRPVAVEKVQLLAGRSFDDLENVTDDMSARMSRSLADGMVRGASPHEVAKDMADDVDISRARAETIARTEIIRAHAEGQLQALGDLGVEEVGVAVEWSTTGDDRVCPLCQPLEGVVLKLDEARGMLPRHPGCRCAWIPANVGESDAGQKDTKGSIDRAFKESDLEVTVGKDRPRSILDNANQLWLVRNANPEGINQWSKGDRVHYITSKGNRLKGTVKRVVSKGKNAGQIEVDHPEQGVTIKYHPHELTKTGTATTLDLNNPKALASVVHEAGRSLPDWQGKDASDKHAGEQHKVHIADLHEALRGKLGGASLPTFKDALAKAHSAGHVTLSRQDIPDEGGKMSASELTHGNATFHRVNVPLGH